MAKMPLPETFQHQLMYALSWHPKIAQALKSQDLSKIRNAFAALESSLKKVDTSLLSGHPQMVWNEFAMLLENDAIEGSIAPKVSDANRTFQALTGHVDRLRQQFVMDHTGHAAQMEPTQPQDAASNTSKNSEKMKEEHRHE
jgi:hypothetical protein